MKAPEGTGIVVETADIQNYKCTGDKKEMSIYTAYRMSFGYRNISTTNKHLHDDEEEKDYEDADLGVEPGSRVTQSKWSW